MNANDKNNEEELEESVRIKSERKIKFRNKDSRGLLYGLGMFGLVGWSVAIPTLIMLALGIWIDRTYQSPYSWTLMLLVLGIMIGCLNAWYWVSRESRTNED
jgi:ATP synthase protein I